MTAVLVSLLVLLVLAAAAAAASVRILREYERAVVFRLGRLIGAKGPGVVLLVPLIDRMVRVSLRTHTLNIPAQDVITCDNVPARVDAVAYFRVVDPSSSIVEIENFRQATSMIAQTTLRAVLGKADLDALLSQREQLNEHLQQIIDEQTEPWGIKVTTVEIRDVGIPSAMQRAMAKQAEAERERRAKVIRAEAEAQAADAAGRGRRRDQPQPGDAAAALPADAARRSGSSRTRRSSSRSRWTSSSRCWAPRGAARGELERGSETPPCSRGGSASTRRSRERAY